ncbi:MAG TPA: DUF6279 family lipoprotein [Nitrospira sp.]
MKNNFQAGRILLLCTVLVSLAFAGCATTLLYNHADWLIVRQLDSYFDLSKSQKSFAYARLDTILNRHRHEALPRYETVLREAGAKVARGLQPDDLDWAFTQYDQLKRDLFTRFVPDGADFLRLVKDKQIERLRKTLHNRLAREEELLRDSKQVRLTKRADRIVSLAQEWLGPLSRRQEQDMARMAMDLPDTLPLWYAHQLKRNEQLLTLVESRHQVAFVDGFTEWMVEHERDGDPQFIHAVKQQRQHMTALILAIDRLATPEQRRHVLAKLDELANTIHTLGRA